MRAGDTFLVDEPGTSYDSHLWIIVNDPSKSPELIVMVNMTTHRDDKDQACVLDVGDHPYIKRRTCINFSQAKMVLMENLDALIQSGKLVSHQPCSELLLKRIRDAIPNSRMAMDVFKVLVEQGIASDW